MPALPHIRKRISLVSARPAIPVDNGVRRPMYAVSLIVLIVVFRSWTQLGLAAFLPFLYREELTRNPEFVATP